MKSKTKKIVTGAIALSLITVMAVGGTMAYLTKTTEKRANNFTFASEGLNAILTEPNWDGIIDYEYDENGNITPIYDYIDDDENSATPDVPVYGYKDGDKSNPVTDKDDINDSTDRPRFDSKNDTYTPPSYGDEDAQNMIAGQVALKNPIITNTGSIADAWVAAKITFVYAEGTTKAGQTLSSTDMSNVLNAIDIDYNETEWDNISTATDGTSKVFYYTKTLAKDDDATDVGNYGEKTEPIFTQVKVKDTASNEDLKKLEDIGGFAIYIEGFAIQSDIMENYSADTLNSHVKFASDNDTSNKDVDKPGIIPPSTTTETTSTED